MALLRERGLVFGISLTLTRLNVEEVTSEAFITFLLEQGALYGWSFHYLPIGHTPNPELMVTPEQRAYLARRIPEIRTTLGLQIADFWNDGELAGGCIAGARHYFHITANGSVEPCAFVHFTRENIREKSLLEVLRSPIFTAFQQRQPFSQNLLRACPIIDMPEQLRQIVAESAAAPSHPGAELVLQGDMAACLDAHAARWQETADALWEQRHPEVVSEQSSVSW